jgi:ribosomal protein L7Ae-like RNA K-turn-binding protein
MMASDLKAELTAAASYVRDPMAPLGKLTAMTCNDEPAARYAFAAAAMAAACAGSDTALPPCPFVHGPGAIIWPAGPDIREVTDNAPSWPAEAIARLPYAVHHMTGLEGVEIALDNGARTVIIRDPVEDRETVQALADLAEARNVAIVVFTTDALSHAVELAGHRWTVEHLPADHHDLDHADSIYGAPSAGGGSIFISSPARTNGPPASFYGTHATGHRDGSGNYGVNGEWSGP